MKNHSLLTVGVLTSALVVSFAGPASASQVDAPLREYTTQVAMSVTGYDRSVAQANGYKIVTDEKGEESSVPVTEGARRAEAESARLAQESPTKSYADGTCGRASLTTKPIAARGEIAIATSYTLSNGRKSFGHLWKVSGQSRLGTPFTESFSGANNLDNNWNATHFRSLYGFSHGTNSLNLTNHAKLTNGSICTAKTVLNSW